jgi:hypothetical protein
MVGGHLDHHDISERAADQHALVVGPFFRESRFNHEGSAVIAGDYDGIALRLVCGGICHLFSSRCLVHNPYVIDKLEQDGLHRLSTHFRDSGFEDVGVAVGVDQEDSVGVQIICGRR